MKLYQKILAGLGGVLVLLQFFQIDKTNPEADPSLDFLAIHTPSAEIESIIRNSCYDCHSYDTEYPWYTYTQPVGWWIKDHIDHGRDELNFAEFASYSNRRADHKLEEAAEYTLNEEMPLPSYLIAHGDADLTEAQREELAAWFESLRPQYQDIPGDSSAAEEEHSEEDHED